MRLHQKTVHKKKILSWVHTNAVSIGVIIFMVFVLIFGIFGISVAHEYPKYHNHMWLPILLVFLCCVVIVLNVLRLFRRYIDMRSENDDDS